MLSFDRSETVSDTKADMIVNTVNTVGVMGAGVARAVRDRFPEVMGPYKERCRTRDLYPGGVQVLRIPGGPVIVNLASKEHFRDPSRPEWVGLGLINLQRVLSLPQFSGISSVLLPPPGAGLGGLRMESVQGMIRTYLRDSVSRGVRITVSADEVMIADRAPVYAGVGSRETPPDVRSVMTEVAGSLADLGWTLRSGNAIGADIAFERGAPLSMQESYLPWPKEGVPHGIVNITPEHTRLMRSVYASPHGEPWSARMSRSTTLLMTRNGNQVFGKDFSEPSDVVICWTPNGEPTGGTRQAIALADVVGIPVLNLGLPEWEGASAARVVEEASRIVNERRVRTGVPLPQSGPGQTRGFITPS